MASANETALEKADSCFNESNYEEAAIFYKKVLLSIPESQIEDRCSVYLKLGYIYKVLEKFDDAVEIYDRILFIEKRIKNLDLSIRIKIEYAEFLRSINACDKSLEILESIDVANDLEKIDLITQIIYYDRLAAIIVQCKGDNIGTALPYSIKALALARKSKSSYHIATSLNEIGFLKEHLNSPREAITYYLEAIKYWDDKKYRRYSPNACVNIARCYNKLGIIDSTIYFANKGLEIVGDENWFNLLVPLYSEKLSALEQMGRWKEAYEVRWLYHVAALSMRSQEWSDKMATVRGELELEKKEFELMNERAKFENAENVIVAERKIRSLLIFIIVVVLFLILAALFFSYRVKRLNSKLKNTLEENDVLLKEVHHRVKNNMQVVSSLLDLQSSFAVDEKSKAALINSRDRINSLALAHQNLYIEDDLKSINIKNYLQVLVESVVSSDILVNIQIDEGNLEIDKAQALGFVLNELLTNSVKHAWSNEVEEKVIWIKLKKGEKDWSFYYSDNGIGVADKAKFLESPTFGITLIRSFLKRNLKVSISFGEKPGMNIGFTFN